MTGPAFDNSDVDGLTGAGDVVPERVTRADGIGSDAPGRFVPPSAGPVFKNRRRLTAEEALRERQRRAIRRRRRRVAGVVLLGLGSLILLAGGWTAWRTYQAYSHLEAAADQVTTLQSDMRDIGSIDPAAAQSTLSTLQADSASARSAVSDPIFRAASALPWVGPNLRALSEIVGTVDSLSTDVVPSLVKTAGSLRPAELAPRDGVIDLAPILSAVPSLQAADTAVNASQRRLVTIDGSRLVGPLNAALMSLRGKLDDASASTGVAARAARLLPPMLGSEQPRTYLVVFQNLAEPRATGGIFGSFAVVRVDDGKISVVDQGTGSRTLKIFDPPVGPLTTGDTSLYSRSLGIYPQDVNLTPDFPLAADLFAKMYTQRTGVPIDGVIATDPVALSYALKGTGPIDVGHGVTLTSKTVVPVLLSTAYSKFAADTSQQARDAFLAHATTVAFGRVVSGSGNPAVIMNGLKQAVRERRVLVWSAHPAEQTDIEQTTLAGRLAATSQDPSIGVFLNDGTGAKLGYYLTNSVKVTPGQCQPDHRRQLHVAITLRYRPPSGNLPSYVLGSSAIGQRYELQTNVLVFAPVGGGVVGVTRDGTRVGVQRGEDRSREVGQVTVVLKPGSTTTLTATVLSPAASADAAASVTPALVLTPGVHPWQVGTSLYETCSGAG